MGSITNVSIGSEKKKVEVKISMNYAEYIMLQGNATNVRVFSEDAPSVSSRVRTSGKKGETKYLLVPKPAKKEIAFNSNVTCQIRDIGDKVIIFYVIDK
ncbi:MAG TPA: hypothetical protein VFF28_06790 [Candidatus Nanoarchaeia archaeon]|nr:hypothetical protein [Candidatus Nanoarchaeia archaeon]